MVFDTLFFIGLIGLVMMAALGVGHHQMGGHHASSVGHVGQVGHSGGAHAGHDSSHGDSARRAGGLFLTLLSPITLMSLCLGAGATGMILQRQHLHGGIVDIAAAAGAIVFYGLLVRPLWSLIFRFASNPSVALDGATAHTAEAMTRFDEHGKGVVRLNVDGQIVRVLATLESGEEKIAATIEPGEQLVVTSVDGHANTCRVARL